MGRVLKEVGIRGIHESVGMYGSGEYWTVMFVLWASLLTLSLLAAILFCADGPSKNSTKASAANTNHHASACAAAGCGAACGA